MCGSFTCSKRSLILLNIFYMVVAVILIGVAGAAKYSAKVTSLKIVSGIIACGIFLLIISIVGIVAASKHHQVLLFFYMIVLFIIFVIQFAVACACLAISEPQEEVVARQGWRLASTDMKSEAQKSFHCCRFELPGNDTAMAVTSVDPYCDDVRNATDGKCCPDTVPRDSCCKGTGECYCPQCKAILTEAIASGFSAVGGVGLFFSFTEIVGFTVAHRYRHQMDPRANIHSLLQR